MKLRYTGKAAEADINMLASGWLEELMDSDEKVVYLDADLMASLKTQALWRKRPDRVFNCGIQEANMVGTAAGLFLAGYKPYIHTFTPFVTRRTYDQLVVSIAYAQKSLHMIGTDAGIMATDNGGTHMSFEDVAIMRVIPNACIVDVTDAVMFHAMLQATKDRKGITYYRTPRRGCPDVYEEGTVFCPGKGMVLTEGNDVTIVASGIMVATALDAAKELEEENIHARVVDPVTIKPLDEELLVQCAVDTGAVVTAENANIIGGLGSAVAEVLTEKRPVPIFRVGIRDCFGQTGPQDYLRQQYGLTAAEIIKNVKKAIRLKGEMKWEK